MIARLLLSRVNKRDGIFSMLYAIDCVLSVTYCQSSTKIQCFLPKFYKNQVYPLILQVPRLIFILFQMIGLRF